MAVLMFIKPSEKRQTILDFDPIHEDQSEIEERNGVSFSEYFETRALAEQTVALRQTDSW